MSVLYLFLFRHDFFLFDTKRMSSHLKIVQLVKFSLSAVLSCHLRHGFAYFPTLFYHFFQVFFTLFLSNLSHFITLFLPRRRMSLIWCCCSSVNWRLLKKSCSQACSLLSIIIVTIIIVITITHIKSQPETHPCQFEPPSAGPE